MIKEADYYSVIEYVKEQLRKQMFLMTHVNGYPTKAVPHATIEEMNQLIKYEQYLVECVNKKGKKKEKKLVEGKYAEEWKVWWQLWPTTKSVPGTTFKSGAVMKKDEQKMYSKWLAAIESGKITIPNMQYAAQCYLEWCYSDSKRLGRNEMQYRNGMESWLNGEMYLNYISLDMPAEIKDKKVYQNSTDM